MRFALLLLLLVTPAFSETVTLEENVSQDVLAVQVLIDQFGDQRLVMWPDPVYETKPVYAALAQSAGSFGECAVKPLTEALCSHELQVRIGGAIGLETVGPAAIGAEPILREMLESQDEVDQKLACGVIRGIGPGAVDLTPQLQILLHSGNFHVQYWACRALGSIGPDAEDAVPELLELLSTGIASVRRNAAIALGQIGPGLSDNLQGIIVTKLLVTACDDILVPVKDACTEALLKFDVET
ncbi:MAG: HEAT repeat domain-containing protein [Planctomycetota bacterium]|jgi:hypothetical protein